MSLDWLEGLIEYLSNVGKTASLWQTMHYDRIEKD